MSSTEISLKVSVLQGDKQTVCAALCWSVLPDNWPGGAVKLAASFFFFFFTTPEEYMKASWERSVTRELLHNMCYLDLSCWECHDSALFLSILEKSALTQVNTVISILMLYRYRYRAFLVLYNVGFIHVATRFYTPTQPPFLQPALFNPYWSIHWPCCPLNTSLHFPVLQLQWEVREVSGWLFFRSRDFREGWVTASISHSPLSFAGNKYFIHASRLI